MISAKEAKQLTIEEMCTGIDELKEIEKSILEAIKEKHFFIVYENYFSLEAMNVLTGLNYDIYKVPFKEEAYRIEWGKVNL